MQKFFLLLNLLMVINFGSCGSNANKTNKTENQINQEPNIFKQDCLIGSWSGHVDTGLFQFNLLLNVKQNIDQTLEISVSCIEQGFSEIPVEFMQRDHILYFNIPSLGAVCEGRLNAEKTEIRGEFKRGNEIFYVTLKKDSFPLDPPRPQEAKAPYPYHVENVNYTSLEEEISLSATLTLPQGEGPFPAVFLIGGSGPTDRDETVFGHKPFFVLADYLTRQGIAVLRTDKRGVGKSSGSYELATTLDFIDDTLAGIRYLKSRQEIDKRNIGLIGHSEGGLIAPCVSTQSKDVSFIVCMASPGVLGEELLYEQGALIYRAMGIDEEQIAHQIDFQKKFFSVLKEETNFQIAQERLNQIISQEIAIFPEERQQTLHDVAKEEMKIYNSPWFRYFLTFDPKESFKQIQLPILVLNGELDLQVSAKQNLPAIAEALQEAGNRDMKIIEFPKLNHLFQTCTTGAPIEYSQIEETIAPIVLETISTWILEKTKQEV